MDMAHELLEIYASITADLGTLISNIPTPRPQFCVQSVDEQTGEEVTQFLEKQADHHRLESLCYKFDLIQISRQGSKSDRSLQQHPRVLGAGIDKLKERYTKSPVFQILTIWHNFSLISYKQVRRTGSKCDVLVRAISKELSTGMTHIKLI